MRFFARSRIWECVQHPARQAVGDQLSNRQVAAASGQVVHSRVEDVPAMMLLIHGFTCPAE